MAKFSMTSDRQIIYQSEAGPRALRASHGPWKIFSVLDSADAEIAKAELAGGADGLVLTTVASVEALRDLPLHKFSIRNQAGDVAARALVEMIARQPIDPARLDISFAVSTVTFADELAKLGFAGPFFEARSDDMAQILRVISEYGTGVSVRLIADQSMFSSLAKFRAIRILAERLLPGIAINLHGEVAAPTGNDHEHYMLSCVAACFGAGLGGADSISILPFSSAGGFERRMARNIQNILLKESHLGEVSDAAAGAGYVEYLTRQICDATWERFQA